MRANIVLFPGTAHSHLGTRLGPILLMGFVPSFTGDQKVGVELGQ